MKKISKYATFTTAILLVSACGGGNSDSGHQAVYNQTHILAEGEQISITLQKGRYRAEITSNNNGVIVSWIGESLCPTSSETKEYSADCNLGIQGQLTVTNPTTFGLGGSETTSIKVYQL